MPLRMICLRALVVLAVLLPALQSPAQTAARSRWVDSVYKKLSIQERIGQLFMVAAYSGGKNYNEPEISRLLKSNQIGGLIFMQGGAARQAILTNQYQKTARVPLLIGMDAEWGLGMRLDSIMDFPRQMMLGATRDTGLVYEMGMAIAYQCKRLGVHVNFAPVIDINNNPNNPVINFRSFGEDKTRVAAMGIAYMRGLQEHGVMACAKHFPGHGDTDADSHKELPVVRKSMAQLDSLELYPFRRLISAGIQSVMVAHLEMPALESGKNIPTTLSHNTITGLLKQQMGFKGLVFTDALNMQGVAKYFEPGEVDLRAFLAGNDVLLFSQDVPTAIRMIRQALRDGRISERELEQRVKKILAAKYDAGLSRFQPIDPANIVEDLNRYTAAFRTRIARQAITLVRDRNNLLPRLAAGSGRIGYIGVNASSSELASELQAANRSITTAWLPKGSGSSAADALLRRTASNDVTIIAIHNLSSYPGRNYGLDDAQMDFIRQAQARKDVVLVLMGNPYLLKNFCDAGSALVGYEDNAETRAVMARMLQGTFSPQGQLPVTPCPGMQSADAGRGALPRVGAPRIPAASPHPHQLQKVSRLSDAGVTEPKAIEQLNQFLQTAVANGTFPGCRVLAAKDGKVFYNEAFGHLTFGRERPVTNRTLYDVASLTKVLATTLAVMHLYDHGRLDLDQTVGHYLPWTRGTDKAGLRIRDLLLHQAGLRSYIPFWKETVDAAGNLRADLFREAPEPGFNLPVASKLYIRNDYPDTVWSRILAWPLENKGRSVYSDLDFYFLAAIVSQVSGMPLDQYVSKEFYKPMGLKHITYNPLQHGFDSLHIAPTERDFYFRHREVWGYVHDQGAAMMGGVAGHAGLFATANDVAVILQMLLNKGIYKDKRYFRKQTVDLFTAYGSTLSRRALGFDKPDPSEEDGGPAGVRVSGYAFGHQGFTGTAAWADPETGVVFVILTNRTYPTAENKLINRNSVRTLAQDYIYEALGIPANTERPVVREMQTRTGISAASGGN